MRTVSDTVVRKRFGDAIRQTVLEEVIRESWETAKTSESLKPITDPSIRNLKFEEGSPIEFELHVEVRPELKLGVVTAIIGAPFLFSLIYRLRADE